MKKEYVVSLVISAASAVIAVSSIVVSAQVSQSCVVRLSDAEATIEKLKTVAKSHSESLDSQFQSIQSIQQRNLNESVKKAEKIMDRYEAGQVGN